jgi:hypothetical protein
MCARIAEQLGLEHARNRPLVRLLERRERIFVARDEAADHPGCGRIVTKP